ncbi:MFS transporter [Halomonas sp. 1513]|nr:MFS transporter [Halomonas sp. 1513]
MRPGRSNTVAGEPSLVTMTSFTVLGGISLAHLVNDTIQSILLAIYPLLQVSFSLSFAQIGLITLCYQLSASLLQPGVGWYTDRRPLPFSLIAGMGFTLLGLLLLAVAPSFYFLLLAAVLVGTGSAIFHPEASRVARMASGSRHGLAQSLFQVGGNAGSALGPLLAALVIIPHGQASVAWLALAALVAMLVLWRVGQWYREHRAALAATTRGRPASLRGGGRVTRRRVGQALAVLGVLILSKYFYLASLNNYFTFYLMERFGLSIPAAQLYLFLFLAAVAVGTLIGGPVGDRIGRKRVIWASILGVAPFTLLLPHVGLWWTAVLVVIIGVVLASAFSAIVVYAQELVPGRIGLISGLFFGLAFGMAGIAAALLGYLADQTSIETVYRLCAYLPLLGIVAWWLPTVDTTTT